MPNDRLLGELEGVRPPSRPRSRFNDVTLRYCKNCRINGPYRDAQDRLLWRDKRDGHDYYYNYALSAHVDRTH